MSSKFSGYLLPDLTPATLPFVPGRSTREVAARIGCSERQTLALLRSLRRAGLTEEDGGGWRLSARAERQYGWALQDPDGWLRELSGAAA